MLFNSLDFAIFFVAVMVAYPLLSHRRQNLLLLAASYLFYGWWNWRFLGLIFTSSILDFSISHLIRRSTDRSRKRRLLICALVINFGVLFVFKYFDFFIGSMTELLTGLGVHVSVPTLRLVLPVGISFLTFQEMGYTVDVYRGEMEPADSLTDYLLFVSYFPHLVAGPIQRSSHLLRQLQRPRTQTPERVYSGLLLMLWGLLKKVTVADNLATYVDNIYTNAGMHSGVTIAFATYLFAFQIYCDFCGYSDMALGMSRILGIDLIYNFRTPYFASSVKDFWRRWHISLSTWFRDYLYIPLGGSRVSRGRDALNIMIVFVVSGLWHGANWTFVVWGALHGLFLVAQRFWGGALDLGRSLVARILTALLTFHLVTFAWIFFRATSLRHAGQVLHQLTKPGPLFWFPPLANGLVMLLAMLVIELAKEPLDFDVWLFKRAPWLQLAAVSTLIFGLLLFGSQEGGQFIYFQF